MYHYAFSNLNLLCDKPRTISCASYSVTFFIDALVEGVLTAEADRRSGNFYKIIKQAFNVIHGDSKKNLRVLFIILT